MKKHERLLAIAKYAIENPKLNIFAEPDNNKITIRENQIFYGELYVENYSNYSDLIFIDVLKGYVDMDVSMHTESNYLTYQVNSINLVSGYLYEDEITLIYPGGAINIEFQILVDDKKSLVEGKTDYIEINNDMQVAPKQHVKRFEEDEAVKIFFEKRTYSLEDAIELKLYNYSDQIKSIIIETTHDLIHPKNTEFFLKDAWTQEWYIQQTTWDKIIGRTIFKEMPFEEIVFNIHVDAGVNSTRQRNIRTTLTTYTSYATPIMIANEVIYRISYVQCMKAYIYFLLDREDKKELIHLVDLIKACLNFDQMNFEMRLLYLWILVDMGSIRKYEQEAKFIRKYHDYYQTKFNYPIFVLFEEIIKRRIGKRHFLIEKPSDTKHWLLQLIQIRYLEKGVNRYTYYQNMYKANVRHGFLFAEAVRFLNRNNVMLESEDRFYGICIQWALNKGCLDKHWLHHILSHQKVWIRKNPYMSSQVLMQLYKEYPSIDLLHLCCEKSIQENRMDVLALEYYKIGLAEGRYIKDLDRMYIESVTALNQHIDFGLLKYMNFLKNLSVESKGYVYGKMIEADIMDYSRFSRIYQDLVEYIRHMTHDPIYMKSVNHILFSMKKQVVHNHIEVIKEILDQTFIEYMKETSEGRIFLRFLIDYIIERKKEHEMTALFSRLEKVLKPEGIILLSDKADLWYQQNPTKEKKYLKNRIYKTSEIYQNPLTAFLNKLLVESSSEELLAEYEQLLLEEKEKVRHILCEIICHRILIDEMAPTDRDKRFLQHCYELNIQHTNGLLLTLVKVFSYHDCIDKIKERDAIVPWFGKNSGKTAETSIQYYGEPNEKLLVFYRYEEDEEFRSDVMRHIAYGMYIYPIYVFYGEYFEYFILKKNKAGQDYIVVSDIIHKQTADVHLDFIAFAMEIGDSRGVDSLVDEFEKQREDRNKLKRI